MKLQKRILTATLAVLLSAMALTSCGAPDAEVPEGMQLASLHPNRFQYQALNEHVFLHYFETLFPPNA